MIYLLSICPYLSMTCLKSGSSQIHVHSLSGYETDDYSTSVHCTCIWDDRLPTMLVKLGIIILCAASANGMIIMIIIVVLLPRNISTVADFVLPKKKDNPMAAEAIKTQMPCPVLQCYSNYWILLTVSMNKMLSIAKRVKNSKLVYVTDFLVCCSSVS